MLDIEDAAPRPGRASALLLRRVDPRRASTQAWRVLPPGRMCCAHANLCVQPDNGLMALTPGECRQHGRGVRALPPTDRLSSPFRQPSGAWAARVAQRVRRRACRAGRGMAHAAPRLGTTRSGPNRRRAHAHSAHLRPRDAREYIRPGRTRSHTTVERRPHRLRVSQEAGWLEGGDRCSEEEATAADARWREWGVRVAWAGLGVSLVGRAPPTELVHARFAHVQLELAAGPRAARLTLVVHQMQWDNQVPSPRTALSLARVWHALKRRPTGLQLLGTPSPVLLYCLPDRSSSGASPLPALHAAAELMRTPARRYNAYFFRHLIVALRPLAVRLEERYVATDSPLAPHDLALLAG